MHLACNVNARRAQLAVGLCSTCALAWAFASAPANFLDVTKQSGVEFRLENSPTSEKFLPETMGGGVALLDYDNDGRLDIFFVNGARLSPSMNAKDSPDKSDPRFWNRMFHQNKDGSFEDVTERAGLRGDGYSMGVAAAD